MIITKKKDIEAVAASLNGKKSVYLFGCDSCAEQCATGGKKEVTEMTRALEERGFKVLGSSIPAETCYRQLVLKTYREDEAAKKAEAVLVLARRLEQPRLVRLGQRPRRHPGPLGVAHLQPPA